MHLGEKNPSEEKNVQPFLDASDSFWGFRAIFQFFPQKKVGETTLNTTLRFTIGILIMAH